MSLKEKRYDKLEDLSGKTVAVAKGFCFDNELQRHKVYLQNSKLSRRLVTNAEYLAFMEAGGYEKSKLWLSEGWAFVQTLETKAPMYWHHIEGDWYQYQLAGLKKVDPDAPVTHLSYFEADAYAQWKGMRLPTEFEWEVVAQRSRKKENPGFQNFSDSNRFEVLPESETAFHGNAWEWTQSAYLPYPGFKIAEGAIGEYNGKFMINQMVLRGGSCATPANHIRSSYRNFFHPHLRWQFNAIRLASDASYHDQLLCSRNPRWIQSTTETIVFQMVVRCRR
jgi:ergothioneine biosynthesis protein EgtB